MDYPKIIYTDEDAYKYSTGTSQYDQRTCLAYYRDVRSGNPKVYVNNQRVFEIKLNGRTVYSFPRKPVGTYSGSADGYRFQLSFDE